MKKERVVLPQTADACRVLGREIAIARRARRVSAAELAERVGVSLVTLRRTERGDPTVAIGTVFEAAAMVGLDLFGSSETVLSTLARSQEDRLALLPSRVRARQEVRISSDF